MPRLTRLAVLFMLSFGLLLAGCQPAAPTTPGAATAISQTSAPAATLPPATSIGTGAAVLRLATTTSTAETGLLNAILPAFSASYNARIDVVAVSAPRAAAAGASGAVDVVLLPAGPDEQKFIANSDGINRLDVMANDYVIVGPKHDPASVLNMGSGACALSMIAALPAPFVSRGDQSDSNLREVSLWASAGVTQTTGAAWYQTTGQGMAETLAVANQKPAYALTDRATWLAQKANLPNLDLLVGGATQAANKDPELLNPYGVIPVNSTKHPKVNFDLATKFANWITSLDTQQQISDFGRDKLSQPLFFPSSAAWKAAHP